MEEEKKKLMQILEKYNVEFAWTTRITGADTIVYAFVNEFPDEKTCNEFAIECDALLGNDIYEITCAAFLMNVSLKENDDYLSNDELVGRGFSLFYTKTVLK